MTDTNALITRLEVIAKRYALDEVKEAADALEAQARRIAGYQKDADDYLIRLDELNALRARIDELERMLAVHRLAVDVDAFKARIEELEAALKPFADCGVWDGYKDEEVFKLGFKIADLRAARAALEKK